MKIIVLGNITNINEFSFDSKCKFDFDEKTHLKKLHTDQTIENTGHIFKKLFLGSFCLFYITETNECLYYGYQDQSKSYDHSIIKKFKRPVLQIYNTLNVTATLLDNGSIYFWNNFNFQQNPEKLNFSNAKEIVVKLSLGDVYNVLLTQNGRLFDINFKLNIVKKIECEEAMVEAECGNEHVILLSKSGEVYTYGLGNHGQLGHGTTQNETLPVKVEALEGLKIVQVAAGSFHSVAISETEDIYTWGWDESLQLGIPRDQESERVTFQFLPCLVYLPFEIHITKVTCGSRHCLILLENKEVWGWGLNKQGQIIPGGPKLIGEPTKLSFNYLASDVQAHLWSTLIYTE